MKGSIFLGIKCHDVSNFFPEPYKSKRDRYKKEGWQKLTNCQLQVVAIKVMAAPLLQILLKFLIIKMLKKMESERPISQFRKEKSKRIELKGNSQISNK